MTGARRFSIGLVFAAVVAAILLFIAFGIEMRTTARKRAERETFGIRQREYEVGPPPLVGDEAVTAKAPNDEPVVGYVVDEGSAPIMGATIAVFSESETQAIARSELAGVGRIVKSNEEGVFTVARQPVGQGWKVVARHPEFLTAQADLGTRPLRVVMKRGLSIGGRVVTIESATPVPGVRVCARGIGARLADSDPAVFAPPAAAVSVCSTESDGSFLLSGLAEQDYQLEIYAPGLTVIPTGLETGRTSRGQLYKTFGRRSGVSSVFYKALVAAAGATDIVVQVAPVALGRFRCVDQTNGWTVPHVNYWSEPIRGFEAWPTVLAPDNKVIVANGRTELCSARLQDGGFTQVWISHRWPIPGGASAKVHVSSDGFKDEDAVVPLVPAGLPKEPTVVRLRPIRPRGGVKLTFIDRDDERVGPASWLVGFLPRGGDINSILGYRVRFGADGTSDILSFPVGEFKVQSQIRASDSVCFQPVAVAIRAGEVSHVTLRLASSAALVSFVDEHGRPLDDVGYLLSPASESVPGRRDARARDARAWKVSGFPVVRPGLGHVPSQVCLACKPGSWLVHGFRHGYEDARHPFQLEEGKLARVRVALRQAPGGVWGTMYRR